MMPAMGFFDLQENLELYLRIAASVGGFVVGWFVAGPLTRLLIRTAFHRPSPAAVVWLGRLGGAGLSAFLLFTLLPLGWGEGGPGYGPGPGGQPGPGGGSDKKLAKGNGTGETKDHKEAPKARETVVIELAGPKNFKGDGRFYLVQGEKAPLSLKEIEKLFRENKDRWSVQILITMDSVGENQGAVKRLRNLADKYKLPTTIETPKTGPGP